MTLSQVKLDDPRSLRAYAHPLRLSLIGLLRGSGRHGLVAPGRREVHPVSADNVIAGGQTP